MIQKKFTNSTNLCLPYQLLLAMDKYDHDDNPNLISVTTLLKSYRQIILSRRVANTNESATRDIVDNVASAIGTAMHTALETAIDDYSNILPTLGYPSSLINRIKINPSKEELTEDTVPIYTEQRGVKEVGSWLISGKFDYIIEGMIYDLKSTSTYTYLTKCKDEDYILQASMYRWLFPEIVTSDMFTILYVFTDWNRLDYIKDKDNYPPQRLMEKKFSLMSLQETDKYIKNKLYYLDKYKDTSEQDLPLCNDKELWIRGQTVWKYYKNPQNTSKSTKNFTSYQEANTRLANDGYVGIIKEVKPLAKACGFCSAKNICSQYKSLKASGLTKE